MLTRFLLAGRYCSKDPHEARDGYSFIPNCRAPYITSSIAIHRFSNLQAERDCIIVLWVQFVVVVVSHIQRIGCQPEKTTLHVGQSRSWSAEQGKENKRKVWQHTPPPPPTLLVRRKIKNKNHATHLQALRRSRSVSRRYKDIFGSSTRHWANGCGFAKFYTPVCDNKFPNLVASLFSWRCLAASTSSFLHAAIHLHPPSVTVSAHTSAFNAVAFQFPAMPNARMSL